MKKFNGAINLAAPLMNRSLNFLVLPFVIHNFTTREFVEISIYVLMVNGITLVASFGIGPRIMFLVKTNQAQGRRLRAITRLLVIGWSITISLLLLINALIDLPELFLPTPIILIAIAEGVVLGITQDLYFGAMKANSRLITVTKIQLLSTIILGPVRVIILIITGLTVLQWILISFLANLAVFVFLFGFISRIDLVLEKTALSSGKVFGIWNLFVFFPPLLWICGNLDRFVLVHILESRTAQIYLICYQCVSLLGLIGSQLIAMDTGELISTSTNSRKKATKYILKDLYHIFVFLIPPIFALFLLLVRNFEEDYLRVFFVLLLAQLVWLLLQIKVLYLSSTLSLGHLLPALPFLALLSQLIYYFVAKESMDIVSVSVIPLIGYVAIYFMTLILETTTIKFSISAIYTNMSMALRYILLLSAIAILANFVSSRMFFAATTAISFCVFVANITHIKTRIKARTMEPAD